MALCLQELAKHVSDLYDSETAKKFTSEASKLEDLTMTTAWRTLNRVLLRETQPSPPPSGRTTSLPAARQVSDDVQAVVSRTFARFK
jgi:hypothetical protein